MKELIVNFTRLVNTHFNGKTVGQGGDFGDTLTKGPFTISTYFHQWQEINNPSLHVQVIQEAPVGGNFECCGGITALKLDIRISVDQKEHGWSIAMAIYEEVRNWLCEINYSTAPDTEDYLVIIDQNSIIASHVYEGDVFSIHVMVDFVYNRRYEE